MSSTSSEDRVPPPCKTVVMLPVSTVPERTEATGPSASAFSLAMRSSSFALLTFGRPTGGFALPVGVAAGLVFGAADEKRGYQRYAPQALHPKTVGLQGLLADECAGLMKEFFKKRR
jgi:hypothetical protein